MAQAQKLLLLNLQIWSKLGFTQSHLQRVIEIQTPAGQTKLQTLLHDVQASCDFICLILKVIIPRSCCPMLTGHRFYLVRVIHKTYYNLKLLSSAVENPVHGKQVAYDFAYYLAERAFIFAVVWLKALMQRHIRAA